jgi:hypothetical protein
MKSMVSLPFAILFLFSSLFLCADEPAINVGTLVTIERAIDVPPEAYPALEAHMSTLIASRPLPWPCAVEQARVANGTLVMQVRIIRPGTVDIPLGVLWWGGTSYTLPTLSYTAATPQIPHLSLADLLWPFPEAMMELAPAVVQQQKAVIQEHQKHAIDRLFWQSSLRHGLLIVCILVVCAPLIWTIWRYTRRVPPTVVIPVTPQAVLQEAKTLRERGEEPWSQLIHALNIVASDEMASLTSFELHGRFEVSGNRPLAQASAFIEQHGYGTDSNAYFDQAARLVEQAVTQKGIQ